MLSRNATANFCLSALTRSLQLGRPWAFGSQSSRDMQPDSGDVRQQRATETEGARHLR